MSKTCHYHQCFKKKACPYKFFLGRLALCALKISACRYRALKMFGRYDLEDIILP